MRFNCRRPSRAARPSYPPDVFITSFVGLFICRIEISDTFVILLVTVRSVSYAAGIRAQRRIFVRPPTTVGTHTKGNLLNWMLCCCAPIYDLTQYFLQYHFFLFWLTLRTHLHFDIFRVKTFYSAVKLAKLLFEHKLSKLHFNNAINCIVVP